MSWINIDVDLDTVYDAMSSHDKECMAEWLEEDGFCEVDPEESDALQLSGEETWDELQLKQALQTLWKAWPAMSPEQAAMIQTMAKQY